LYPAEVERFPVEEEKLADVMEKPGKIGLFGGRISGEYGDPPRGNGAYQTMTPEGLEFPCRHWRTAGKKLMDNRAHRDAFDRLDAEHGKRFVNAHGPFPADKSELAAVDSGG
jgi:hypothetical protein